MKQCIFILVMATLATPLFAGNDEATTTPSYLGIPNESTSSQVKEKSADAVKLISRHGEIQLVSTVAEDQFWKDVKENRALYIQVIDGQLFYSVEAAKHHAAPEGVPAPWEKILLRCRVEQKGKAQQPPPN